MLDLDISGERKLATAAVGILDKVAEAYRARQKARAEEFFKFVDLRYENMSVSEQAEFNGYVESEAGQDVLVDYVDGILRTSCKRARMAIALLYCQDYEFNFNHVEIRSFISSMQSINDDLLNFFMMASALSTKEGGVGVSESTERYPYPRAKIDSGNRKTFHDKGWDTEAIFINTNELITLRLLLPDPAINPVMGGDGSYWYVGFGVTNTSQKIASLIRKAESLIPAA
ncbi:hypothetical protein ACMXYO_05380 [Neptuniibacter sp. QD37_6]|uniref:hypothetical protein n=1 Tax=Neptuniibacter sp. QD37_6 TaxID=3398210 RepID=UPI0039F49F32